MEIIKQEIAGRLPLGDESRRLFHGRGHCFSSFEDLTIDWFEPIVLVTLYRQRESDWLETLTLLLREQISACRAVLLQERHLQNAPSRLLWGELPDHVDAVEDGLRYRLRLAEAQNVGFFPDVAIARRKIRQIAVGKNVLNLFAYSCSFSVAALAGGARQVTNLDMNRGALELGRTNHLLNQIDLRNAGFLSLELFRSFGKLKKMKPFDLVICDPPASQGKSFMAEKDWPRLLRKLPQVLSPAAEIVACLNSPYLGPDYLLQLFSDLLPEAKLLLTMQPDKDFPEATEDRGVWIFHYKLP